MGIQTWIPAFAGMTTFSIIRNLSYNKTVIILAGVFSLIVAVFLILTYQTTFSIVRSTASDVVLEMINPNNAVRLRNPPHPIKGIYVSAWTTTSSQKIDGLIKLIKETELNGVVVDVKDYSGKFTYKVDVPLAEKSGALDEIKIKDIDGFINKLHKSNIYVIGRVQVFQDPILAKARPDIAIKNLKTGAAWKDNKGLEWLDPSSRIVWDYAVDIGKDMAKHGFDEVNYDYVRFTHIKLRI